MGAVFMASSSRHPLMNNAVNARPSRSQRLTSVLNETSRHRTTLSGDTAWSVKLKDAVNTAVRELHVQVLSAQPIIPETPSIPAPHDMVFEMDTDQGRLQAIRSHEGTHQFNWL
jgi:hypothetical protein